jgi:hypothetical protein
MWDELGITPSDDSKAIRRAYAARLKTLDPDRDLAGFARLRQALEWALAAAEASSATPPDGRDRDDSVADNALAGALDAPWFDGAATAAPTEPEGDVDAAVDSRVADARDRALVDALDSAIERRDVLAAINLYYRAAAVGAIPLSGDPMLSERLLALAVADPEIDGVALRTLARIFAWDRPALTPVSETRQRVQARLAAEDWYDALMATADRTNGTGRKQAKPAKLLLRRTGRWWRPRIDRAVLRLYLDQYRVHGGWLCNRIDPAWVRLLENWWRRREIVASTCWTLVLTAILIDFAYVVGLEALAGTLPVWAMVVVPGFATFLLWLLNLSVTTLVRLIRRPPDDDDGPPDKPTARLRWLERQAERAYAAMYDAPAGTTFAARYNDAKEFFNEAIALAHHLGHTRTAERLSRRLADIKHIARTQFPME